MLYLSCNEHYMKGVTVPDTNDETRNLFETLYRDFNARDVNAILVRMSEDVEWPKAFEGGYVRGQASVRDYWSRQWAEIDPTVTPLEVADLDDGRVDITVHQVVRDLHGALLADTSVHHVYRLDGGLIAHMEIIE